MPDGAVAPESSAEHYARIARDAGLEYVSLALSADTGSDPVNPLAARLLPEQVCRTFRILSVSFTDGELTLATSDPNNRFAQNVAFALTSNPLRVVVAVPEEIDAAIERVFDPLGELGVGAAPTEAKAEPYEEGRQSGRLGELLVDRNLITLADQLRVPMVDLSGLDPDPRALEALPTELQLEHRCVPLAIDAEHLYVAISDPLDDATRAALRERTGLHIRAHLATRSDLDDLLRRIHQTEPARTARGAPVTGSPGERANRRPSNRSRGFVTAAALAVLTAFALWPTQTAATIAITSVVLYPLISRYVFGLYCDLRLGAAPPRDRVPEQDLEALEEGDAPVYTSYRLGTAAGGAAERRARER